MTRTVPQSTPGSDSQVPVEVPGSGSAAGADGDRGSAAHWLATMTAYAQAHGNLRYQAVAAELAVALAAGTPLADLPRLVWGGAVHPLTSASG